MLINCRFAIVMRIALILFTIIFLSPSSFAQLEWESRASLPNHARINAVSEEIKGKIYVAIGTLPLDMTSLSDELWAYDIATNTWEQKKDFPGGGRTAATSFTINNKLYITCGSSYPSGTGNVKNDLYEYDPASNTWTKKADFPGAARYMARAFVIGDTAYVVGGSCGAKSCYYQDMYMYVQSNNTWTKRADYPGGKIVDLTTFTLDGYGYAGLFIDNYGNMSNSFYKYNPKTDSWSSIAKLPGSSRWLARSFSLNGDIYVGCGRSKASLVYGYNDFYRYDALGNKWTNVTSNKDFRGRANPIILTIGDSVVYAGLGVDSTIALSDFWVLKTNFDTCDYYDTLVVYDTISHIDSFTFVDTLTVLDTIVVYDTLYITIYDTLTIKVYDTTFINVYDTVAVTVIDTVEVTIFDTVKVYVLDTIYATIYDTLRFSVFDTVFRYISVTDTLIIDLYNESDSCRGFKVVVYPNPTNENVNIFTRDLGCFMGYSLQLYNQLGQLVDVKVVSKEITTFDIRGLAQGVYHIRFINKQGVQVTTKSIIID